MFNRDGAGTERYNAATMKDRLPDQTTQRQAFRQGASLFVPVNVPIPPICIRCGEPSTETVLKKYRWYNPWLNLLLLLGILIGAIIMSIYTKSAKVAVPLCATHWRRRKQINIIATLLLIGFIPVAALGTAYQAQWATVVGLLMAPIALILCCMSPLTFIRATRIDQEWAILKGADLRFLLNLPAQPEEQSKVVASDASARMSKPFKSVIGRIYVGGAWVTGVLAFLGAWIYAAVTYGLFLGIGLGWVPSIVIGLVAGLLWPVLLMVGVVALVYIENQ